MTKQNLSFLDTIKPFFKGIGQIMLQNNAWTGLLFMVGICCGSYVMGIAAIFAVITGTTTAMLLKYPNDEISDGLYGFSAALVGVALICFFQPTVATWAAILIGSVLATVIQRLFIAKKIPAFTFPFILVTWLFLCLFHYFPSLVKPQLASNDTNNYLTLFAHGFGQVIFQVNIWAGILFMIGIFISRPIAAIYAIVGIALSSMIAYQLKEPVNDIYLGLLSYNAVLCAITFAGKKREDLIRGLIAVILSVLIMIKMRDLNLPALTFPFVLATWLVLIIKIIPLKASNK
ncbi:urea transporter [Pedobacter sp. ASV28]|uniref:urea transporter n=1 Tax=Pedobacter sp. ASV28 TaxID=2795123 RepID=UPI0018ECB71C|nr:urea transporter [Pedobacter sp. ASV28]